MISVSVVVPTYHRPELLDRCLAALAAQVYPANRFEIIVVDDGASDETARLVARWARLCRAAIRYLPATGAAGHGPAAARNQGWRSARGAVIAFTDDDCIPDSGWLLAGVAALGGPRPGTVPGQTSREQAVDPHPVPASAFLAGGWGRTIVPVSSCPTDYERDAAGLERAEAITANVFYRREALAIAGGFDERFRAAWREDSDLYFTLLELGARVERIPAALVVHPVRPTRWGVCLMQQRKGRYNALLYKKHPRLYHERIQSAPPWNYYATVAAALLATLGLGRGRRRLALGAACCWAWRTGRFCSRRLAGTRRTPGHVAEMLVTSALIPPWSVYWRLRGAVEFRVPFL